MGSEQIYYQDVHEILFINLMQRIFLAKNQFLIKITFDSKIKYYL